MKAFTIASLLLLFALVFPSFAQTKVAVSVTGWSPLGSLLPSGNPSLTSGPIPIQIGTITTGASPATQVLGHFEFTSWAPEWRLDECYDFRWVTIMAGYSIPYVGAQAKHPVAGALPAIWPPPGQSVGGVPADNEPFFYNTAEFMAHHAEHTSSTFSYTPDFSNSLSLYTFSTFLVVRQTKATNFPGLFFQVLPGFVWTYDAAARLATVLGALPPNSRLLNWAIHNSVATHKTPHWTAEAWFPKTTRNLFCPSQYDLAIHAAIVKTGTAAELNRSIIQATMGVELQFSAHARNSTDWLNIEVTSDLPKGSVADPFHFGLAQPNRRVSMLITWTPTAAQTGSHKFTFESEMDWPPPFNPLIESFDVKVRVGQGYLAAGCQQASIPLSMEGDMLLVEPVSLIPTDWFNGTTLEVPPFPYGHQVHVQAVLYDPWDTANPIKTSNGVTIIGGQSASMYGSPGGIHLEPTGVSGKNLKLNYRVY